MGRTGLAIVLLLLGACGDDGGDEGDDGPRDAGKDAGAVDASRPLDAAVDPGADASEDARVAIPDDASVPTDAARDASPDAAVPPTLRAAICGEQTSWPDPLPNARTAKRVEDGFGFLEGPVWVRERGVLLFSDMNMLGGGSMVPPSRIRRLTPPQAFDGFVMSSGSNGLALFGPNTLLAATHDTRSLSFFDATSGARTNITITYQNKRFNSPNDVAIRDDGWVYFSDPDWQLGGRMSELKMALYRVQLTASTTTASALLIEEMQKPNGVALSPDQKTLYVGSTGDDIFKYDVAADGSVGNKTSFAKVGGSDGLAVDCAGNLYVASGTVEVFAPNGDKRGDIMVGDNPSNAAFGGADAKTLYITAQDSLYAIDLNVPGFPN